MTINRQNLRTSTIGSAARKKSKAGSRDHELECTDRQAAEAAKEKIMADFLEAARLDQVPPGTGMCFNVAGKDVAIFNVDGTIYAMDDSCVHQGASLGSGKLDGKVVTCPGHGMRYDVTTGSTITSPGYGVASYPAKVVDGKILVAI